jgi:hypothetical protein
MERLFNNSDVKKTPSKPRNLSTHRTKLQITHASLTRTSAALKEWKESIKNFEKFHDELHNAHNEISRAQIEYKKAKIREERARRQISTARERYYHLARNTLRGTRTPANVTNHLTQQERNTLRRMAEKTKLLSAYTRVLRHSKIPNNILRNEIPKHF